MTLLLCLLLFVLAEYGIFQAGIYHVIEEARINKYIIWCRSKAHHTEKGSIWLIHSFMRHLLNVLLLGKFKYGQILGG